MITEDLNTTNLVNTLLSSGWTKRDIAKEIGITRATLNKRLSLHKWKVSEKKLVKRL